MPIPVIHACASGNPIPYHHHYSIENGTYYTHGTGREKNMKLVGKCSFFGGVSDSGMDHSEGLAYYEMGEASLRPDLFNPQSTDPTEGVSKRLKNTQAYYLANRVMGQRKLLQGSLWKITNPKTGQFVVASLVDYGPRESTGRIADLSNAVGRALRLETDDEIEIEQLT